MHSESALPFLIVLVLCMIFRRFYYHIYCDRTLPVTCTNFFIMGKEMLTTSSSSSSRRRVQVRDVGQRGRKKSENWTLHEEIFGDKLNGEPWSPTEEDFDELIQEQDDFEDAFRLERVKNEELRRDVHQLKRQVKTLTKAKIQLEQDLRRVDHKHTTEIRGKDEIINSLENQNVSLQAELDELKKNQSCKHQQQLSLNDVKIVSSSSSSLILPTKKFKAVKLSPIPPSPQQTDANNNNNNSPLKLQRKASAISDLIKNFEAAAAAEAQAVKAARRKTVASIHLTSL